MIAPDLVDGLAQLRARGIDSMVVEGGGRLAGALLSAGLVDRYYWIQSPLWLGDEGVPAIAGLTTHSIADAARWTVVRAARARRGHPAGSGSGSMFTGIVSAVGTVRAGRRTADGLSLAIATPWRRVARGESVAVDGVCLTVEKARAGVLTFHAIATTLERTLLGEYQPGRPVNLERALRAGDRLGGHLVQGHVDGVGTVLRRAAAGGRLAARHRGAAPRWRRDRPARLDHGRRGEPHGQRRARGRARSRCRSFRLPLSIRRWANAGSGDRVHLEADTIGKYVAALLAQRQGDSPKDGRQ